MGTYIVYFDESGDDGLINSCSDDFVLTSMDGSQMISLTF